MIGEQVSNVQFVPTPISPEPDVSPEVNLKYANTRIGFLKILSVALGLLTLYLSAYAYDNATAFIRVLYAHCNYDKNGTPYYCNYDYYSLDFICEEANEVIQLKADSMQNEEAKKEKLKELQICPKVWLIIPQIYGIGIIWACTVIMLIRMLISNRTSLTFRRVDTLGHVKAALVFFVSGLCFFAYTISVLLRNECKIHIVRDETANDTEERETIQTANSKIVVPPGGVNCPQNVELTFKHWHIFSAGFFAIFTAYIYICIAASANGGPIYPGMGPRQQQQQQHLSPSQAQMQGTASQQQANQPPYVQPGYQNSPQAPPPVNQNV